MLHHLAIALRTNAHVSAGGRLEANLGSLGDWRQPICRVEESQRVPFEHRSAEVQTTRQPASAFSAYDSNAIDAGAPIDSVNGTRAWEG